MLLRGSFPELETLYIFPVISSRFEYSLSRESVTSWILPWTSNNIEADIFKYSESVTSQDNVPIVLRKYTPPELNQL